MSGLERVPVVLALTPVAEQTIAELLFSPGAPVEPLASVAEADELEHVATTTPARVVLLSPALSGLTAACCARVRAAGLRLVGVALDNREHDALAVLGLDAVSTPDQLLATLNRQQGERTIEPATPPQPEPRVQERAGVGSVLAVVGAKGAPGASECAASLAALADERWPSLLVELDALGGGLDVRLGADPQQGSLLGLLRAADAGESALRELLERWLVTAPGWPPVLLGPPDLQRALPELAQPGATTAALGALRPLYPLIVCDVGFLLDPSPNQAALPVLVHREAVLAADVVLLVLGAREQQLRAGLSQLELLLDELAIPRERLRVVLNGLGAPGSTGGSERLLVERLAEHALALDAVLPWDGRALVRSGGRHGPLAAAHPRGGYARATRNLLDDLFLPTVPAPRGRKRKLVPPQRSETGAEEVVLPWRT